MKDSNVKNKWKVLLLVFVVSVMAFAGFVLPRVVTASKTDSKEESGTRAAADLESVQEISDEDAEVENNSSKAEAAVTSSGMIDAADMFTDRDLEQTVDVSDAETIELKDGENSDITSEGIYVVTGTAKNATITVDVADEEKVQIVLDDVSITNESTPCIYVKNADKVFVTLTGDNNTLSVTDEFEADGDTNTDAVVFSKDDLVINGTGTATITSSDKAVACKNTLKITGGELNVSTEGNAITAKEAIEIADGVINIDKCNDGLHAKDGDDDSVGYIYICGGTFNINAESDSIQATTILQIDGGEFELVARECLEATYIQVNGGDINIEASDDGINASEKSSAYNPTFELNGGSVVIKMGSGDTDGVDSNGDIYINGGVIDITGQFTFDYTGNAEYNGGTIIENGEETNTITNQFFGEPGQMGPGGGNPPEGNPPEGEFPGNDGERPEPPEGFENGGVVKK